VIGWALDRTLEDTLTLRALRMALQQRRPAPGLVHHSDRGVQYASGDYTDLLRAQGIIISMSRKASPYDHAKAESFMKTLKYEEVYREDYRDLIEAHAGIGHFLEQVYNQKRLHSAVGYRLSSARRVRVLAAGRPGRSSEVARNSFGKSGVGMSFFRHEEI
jgi:transposase InsO family protein